MANTIGEDRIRPLWLDVGYVETVGKEGGGGA
jgi:hypothetical protein